jgi:ATP-dependent Lon protease
MPYICPMSFLSKLIGKKKDSSNDPPLAKHPKVLPVLPLKDTVLVPGALLPLLVSNSASIELVRRFHEKNEPFIAVGVRNSKSSNADIWENIFKTGCLAYIVKLTDNESGEVSIMVRGDNKVFLESKVESSPLLKASVSYFDEDMGITHDVQALVHSTVQALDQLARLSYHGMDSAIAGMAKIRDPLVLLSTATTTLPLPVEKKQQVLELKTLAGKFSLLHQVLRDELDILETSSRITEQAKGEINHAQREYYLKQQMKAIRKELGESAETENEMDDLRKEIEAKNLPEAVKKDVDKDIKRLSRMQPGSAEYVTLRTYMDWILDIPWHEQSEDELDISRVESILNEDHFNLKRPKKRIMEYLSVKKLKNDMKGPILCFTGPPGVGKTSLGRSIARAMGRKFVRISLGGVRDEAEIKGHRRTYIGALPGRIINGMKTSGTINPVFMLDEIDKLTRDMHGDPASALLEALDPEQNSHFTDHYLNVPYDLSKVLFITTANVTDSIPAALRDRMEIVEIEGYTQEDKLRIAKGYLLPKELEANGLSPFCIKFDDEAITHIIRHYTRESGVRNLQREIASVLRVIASLIARGGEPVEKVGISFVEEALGAVKYLPDAIKRTRIPGISTGLAWTPFGGEVLYVESAMVDGKDELILTGQIGDVMKESARIGLSLIRGMGIVLPKEKSLHIHVPSGAIPKDGPSAGITIVCSLYSLFTGKVASDNLAMTGEITLRGIVLPVGGIKEKVLAAKRAGINRVILPRMNEKDILEIEPEVLGDTQTIYVECIEDVLSIAFEGSGPPVRNCIPEHDDNTAGNSIGVS